MDAFNLTPQELETLKQDLLTFIHNIAVKSNESVFPDARVKVLPELVNLLLQNTGVIRLRDEQLKTVIDALVKAEYEVATKDGLIVTDLPDETNGTLKLDYSNLLKNLREAISILDTSVYSRKEIRI